MKYFTPDRWVRMQRGASKEGFEKAYDEWERAVREYEGELKRIFPGGRRFSDLRRFALHYSLHDADLQACWFGPKGDKLNLLVRPELPQERLFLLVYSLAGEPVVRRGVLPEEFTSKRAVWMYDELGLLHGVEDHEELAFTHNILLSTGCEYVIRFSNLTLTRPQPWPDLSSASDRRSPSLQQTA
ncbi:MAG: hypothetical protein U0797_12515 [Gemmataceae bacterium]